MTLAAEIGEARQAALDSFRGERVRVIPRVAAGWRGPSGSDPVREVREIVGRYRSKSATSELEGNREGSKFQSMTRIGTATHTMRISPAEAARLGYPLQANDTLVLLDRADTPAFAVVRTGLRDSGEIAVELAAGASA